MDSCEEHENEREADSYGNSSIIKRVTKQGFDNWKSRCNWTNLRSKQKIG